MIYAGNKKVGRPAAQSGPSRSTAEASGSPNVSTGVDGVSGVDGVLLGEVGTSSAGGAVGGAGGVTTGSAIWAKKLTFLYY